MKKAIKYVVITLALLMLSAVSWAESGGWPRTLAVGEGLVTIYPLQADQRIDDIVKYRAALAWRAKADEEPVFGAGWFIAPVEIDENAKRVVLRSLTLTQVRFPEGSEDIQAPLAQAIASESPAWDVAYSLDELETDLQARLAEEKSAAGLDMSPPKIIYRDTPAVLVTIDGDPVLREIENSEFKAVINTPYPLISDGRYFYLNVSKDAWFRSQSATGPYRFDNSVPAAIAQMVKPESSDSGNTNEAQEDSERWTATTAPEIVVSTEPAELLVTDGPADFVPLVDDLLVLRNSDDDVFMHVGQQQYFIVLAGRWYQSPSLNGPWSYQAADELPASFAQIPSKSEQAGSRVYVAGTDEAEQAVLDAQVPKTAAVARGEVDLEVDYDGDPNFESVEGTNMYYADNTGSTVLYSDRIYYMVEDGVWYIATTPNGPWAVADHRPDEVRNIHPSSPVYNTKYVYVYDSTPEVVYVGYTPGYAGSYVYGSTIVYGTGYYYRPWVSPRYYYPRHSTWGFHVGYSSWSGWGFGFSWGWGSVNIGYPANYYAGGYWHHNHYWHHRHYGYWGPYGYRQGYRRGYRDGYYDAQYAHHDNRGRGHGRYNAGGGDYDHRGRDNGYSGDDRGRGGRDLYRDDRQRAVITDDSRQARIVQQRKQQFADNGKAGKARLQPVKQGYLSTKAQVRNANQEAGKKSVRADSDGRIRTSDRPGRQWVSVDSRKRGSEWKPVNTASGKSKGGSAQPVQRLQPVSREDLRDRSRLVASQKTKPGAGNRYTAPISGVSPAEKVRPSYQPANPRERITTPGPSTSKSKTAKQTYRTTDVNRRAISSGTGVTTGRKRVVSKSPSWSSPVVGGSVRQPAQSGSKSTYKTSRAPARTSAQPGRSSVKSIPSSPKSSPVRSYSRPATVPRSSRSVPMPRTSQQSRPQYQAPASRQSHVTSKPSVSRSMPRAQSPQNVKRSGGAVYKQGGSGSKTSAVRNKGRKS